MKKESPARLNDRLKKSIVKDENGTPLIVYRGEHGPMDDPRNGMQTLLGSLSFGSKEAASHYATSPNRRDAKAVAPRVYPAHLLIENPFFNNPNDPFIDFNIVEEKLGVEIATQYFVKYAGYAENTNNWLEINDGSQFQGVEDFARKHPERMGELYMELYPLLDDPEFIRILRDHGFDGAVYSGSGETALEPEYRVFDERNVVYALSAHNKEKPVKNPGLGLEEPAFF